MQASVIIPVYNDASRLKLCLDALAKQTVPQDSFEVIVVDNGSDDPPKELVESYPFCRFAEESKSGSYAARNHGLDLAQGRVLAFTDADCVPERDWIAQGSTSLSANALHGQVGGRVQLFAEEPREPTPVELYEFAFGFRQDTNISVGRFAATANMFVTRETQEAVGRFNEVLMSGGDLEWGNRLAEQGRTQFYDDGVVVQHPARKSLATIRRKARRHAGGRFRLGEAQSRSYLTLHAFRVLGKHLVPDFKKMSVARARLREQGWEGWSWLKVCWVIAVVQYTKLYEFLRLRLGGSPENL